MEPVFNLTAEVSGERLDRFLSTHCPTLSRSYLQRLIERGWVSVDGAPSRSSYRLKVGEHVLVVVPPPQPIEGIQPESIPLHLAYEDQDLLVVDKPAGLVVHPAAGHRNHTLVHALLAHCPQLEGIGGVLRPGIVHRLDKDTSGLMVVAKNEGALRSLQRQFQEREVVKRYWALVRGRVNPPQGVIDLPLSRDPRNRKRLAVVPGGRPAMTRYRVLRAWESCSLVEAQLLTGRTHQIRIHFSFRGCPLLGDPVYGVKSDLVARQFLHARTLGIHLPSTGAYREFTSELPDDLQQALYRLDSSSEARFQKDSAPPLDEVGQVRI